MKIRSHTSIVPASVADGQPSDGTAVVEDGDKAERVHTHAARLPGVDIGAARKHLASAMATAQPLDISPDAAEALADLVRSAVLQSDDDLFRAKLSEFSRDHATPALAPLLAMRVSVVSFELAGTAAETFARRAAAIAAAL